VRPGFGSVLLAALVVLLVLVMAEGASAGFLELDRHGNLLYRHLSGFEAFQSHDLVIEQDGADYRLTDAGANISICSRPAPCIAPRCTHGTSLREAVCRGDQVVGIWVLLGEQSDRLENRSALPLVACGGSGSDVLFGGPSRDMMGGGPGRDELRGGGGNDNLAIDLARQQAVDSAAPPPPACEPGNREHFELLDGGAGPDRIEAGPGDDLLLGGVGDDSVLGYAGDDRMDGGGGRDDLHGLEGADRIEGGEGGDFVFGGPGDDDLGGGAGDDSLGGPVRHDADGLGGAATVATAVEEGDDRLDGGEGGDHLIAGPGNRLFDLTGSLAVLEQDFVDRSLESPALNGADTFVGGPGDDLVTYANRALPVAVSLDGLANDGSDGERDRVDADVERVFGGARADTLQADADGALLFGDLDGDRLVGGAGPDILTGGFDDGADVLAGAAGDDELGGGPGADELEGGRGMDSLRAGGGDDEGLGGGDADRMEGGAGSDFLDGGEGPDCLFGFSFPTSPPPGCPAGTAATTPAVGADGADLLRGGAGIDRLEGGDGEDMADYSRRRRRVIVVLPGAARGWTPPPRADQIAADVEGARGGRGPDLVVGNADDNVFDGGPGDDQVEGGRGVDQLRGGSGRDLIVARDRDADAVRCGTKRDLALIDGQDEVVVALSDVCERVDGAGNKRTRGAVRVRPDGDCGLPVRLPGIRRPFLLRLRASLQPGTVVDASACPARVAGSIVRLGAFGLLPDRASGPLGLGLRGGSTGTCKNPELRVRRLAVKSPAAGLTVRGRDLSATGRRAAWTIIDSCRGTRVRVRSGHVVKQTHSSHTRRSGP
jgi:Ca2+-binding RTX toxin-like protein